jgi:hypothetical protein
LACCSESECAKLFSRRECAPELCRQRRARKRNKKNKREAKRRKAHASHCRTLRHGSAPLQTRAQIGTHLLFGARSPSGASRRHLPRRANARTQPRPRFTRAGGCRRYPHHRSRLSEAPRTPVVMPEGIGVCICANCVHLFALPGPPGSGVTSPARRNRTRSAIRCVSRSRPFGERDRPRLLSSRRQSQKVSICADESGGFVSGVFSARARHALDSLALPEIPLPRASEACKAVARVSTAICGIS